MKRSRLIAVSALFVSFGWLLAGGCSSSDGGASAGPYGGGSGGNAGTASGGQTVVAPDASGIAGGSGDDLNPLCGIGLVAGTCIPDDDSACRSYVPPEPGMGGASSAGENAGGFGASGAPQGGNGDGGMSGGGAGSQDTAGGAGGAAGQASAENSGGVGHAGGAGGAGGASGAGGEGGNDNPEGLSRYSCQVGRQGNQATRQCVLAGTGQTNAPCFTAADCAPSLACVADGDAGRCLPYCCDPATTCGSGSYCAERPLLKSPSDASNAEPPHVPVCVPADNCSLEEAFPCPAKSECRCQGDTACMVVRTDGTTACIKPGSGVQGEPCPCAWNHVCSNVTHQCVKICNRFQDPSDCGVQKCQASSELPPNFGICVGPLK